jgi:hypothetical protein
MVKPECFDRTGSLVTRNFGRWLVGITVLLGVIEEREREQEV